MFTKVAPLTADKHGKLRLRSSADYSFASTTHAVRILLSEIPRCACEYPIAFLKSSTQEAYLPVVMLSLAPKQNVFLRPHGQEMRWNARYIPAAIRQYPFTVARGKEDAEGTPFIICIDEASQHLSEEKGSPLFTPNGEESQMLKEIQTALQETQKEEHLTHQFGRLLAEHDLLAPLSLEIKDEDTPRQLSGLYAVSESRLNTLNTEAYASLRHIMGAMYAHITSLGQVESLIERSNMQELLQQKSGVQAEGPLQ